MSKPLTTINRLITYLLLLVVTSVSPVLPLSARAFAEDSDTPCVAPADNQPGVHRPTGSDAGTFTYQCDGAYAGKYTNSYFVYDPATGLKSPLFSRDYQYNCGTGVWTMVDWSYTPARKAFTQSRITATHAPNLPTNCPVAPSSTTSTGPQSGTNISSTGTGSANAATNNASSTAIGTNNTNFNMGNTISSGASTGDALVIGNTTAGSAASGTALSQANVANLLQSTSNVFGPNTVMFTADINGDVNGDFMFDPSALMTNTGTDSNNSANNNLTVNANDTNNVNAQITNNIDVGAASGDATVSRNTTAGDATSGDASAIVNLMNLINSTVTSGQSFVGTVNINGNLNGDILLPQNLIDQLLASSGTGSDNSTTTNVTANGTETNNLNAGIANNVTSSAASGDAAVTRNTNGGSATSGNANTNVAILNMTGSNVIGKNDILVFVNVLGTWVGMIVNAPAGSTSASLGGGITSSGSGSTNASNTNANLTSNQTNNANLGINNNVNVHANSGDATVSGNTTGGNAKSGDANTAVNILNIAGSNLNLSDWFGVLFINVFGNWNGSFGINTAAGDMPTTATGSASQGATASTSNQFASFIAHSAGTGTKTSSTSAPSIDAAVSSVLGNATTVAKKVSDKTASTTTGNPTPDNASHASYALPIIGFAVAAILLFISERSRFFGKK
jgi:hypothetical protein